MPAHDVEVPPSRTYSRYWVLRIAPRRYYDSGGFVVRDGHVSVGDVWTKRISTVAAEQVIAVVCVLVRLRRGDWRVILVDRSNRVLLRTTGLFYSDEELQRLADSIGCDYRREDFGSYRKLDDRYPGSASHWWEKHLILFSLMSGVFGVALIFAIYGIALLFGAH